ncbi:MAG: antitoxin [Xenococcus sp. (in: cyanobacteria)]
MPNSCHVSLVSNGQNQILTIPSEFTLSGTKVLLRKEGDRLVIEPIPANSLLSLLSTLQDISDDFPDIDKGLPPLDEITL